MERTELTKQDIWVIEEARRTGNVDLFTEYFFPNSGTYFTPEDRVEQYDMIHDVWSGMGSPEREFSLLVEDVETEFRVFWDPYYSGDPIFRMVHGYRILPWIKGLVSQSVLKGMAITGVATGKTNGVTIAALALCALLPGFKFLNVAPTKSQADLVLGELEKWVTDAPYRRLIQGSRGANPLWIERPYPTVTIVTKEGYPSRFVCQTVGRDAKNILGGEQDWINADEAALLENISAAVPVLSTRMRGTRSTGELRLGKLTWITNPGMNPELDALKEQYLEAGKTNPAVMVLDGVPSSANVYLTKKQIKAQQIELSERQVARWHGGDSQIPYENLDLGINLFETCKDAEMTRWCENNGVMDDILGLVGYEMPYEPGHEYIVTGDVGKSALASLTSQNVPVLGVFDVTDFLDNPVPLAAFRYFDGKGDYKTFVNEMKRLMRKYRAWGYYDAGNISSAFEDFDSVFGDLPYTTDLYFSGGGQNKKWALAVFVHLASLGLFRWPYIKAAWHQARTFQANIRGNRGRADDIIAMFLVFTLALRNENALYDRMAIKLGWEEDEDHELEEYDDHSEAEDDFHAPTHRHSRLGVAR